MAEFNLETWSYRAKCCPFFSKVLGAEFNFGNLMLEKGGMLSISSTFWGVQFKLQDEMLPVFLKRFWGSQLNFCLSDIE